MLPEQGSLFSGNARDPGNRDENREAQRSFEPPTFAPLQERLLVRSIASNFAAMFVRLPKPPVDWVYSPMFRSALLRRGFWGRSLVASSVLHVALIACLVSFPLLPGPAPARPTLAQNMERTILFYKKADLKKAELLPTVSPLEPKRAPKRRALRPRQAPRPAYSPVQVIISSPPKPDNARQTIVQPEAPDLKLQAHIEVPNMVVWRGVVVPPRPAISEAARPLAQIAVPRLPAPLVAPPLPPEPPKLPEPKRDIAELRFNAVPLADVPKLPIPVKLIPAPTPPAPSPVPLPKRATDVPAPPALVASSSAATIIATTNQNTLRNLISVDVAPAPPQEQVKVPEGNRSGDFAASPAGGAENAASGEGTSKTASGRSAPQDLASRDLGGIRVPNLSITGGRAVEAPVPVVTSPAESHRAVAAPSATPPPNGDALARLIAKATRPTFLPEPSRGQAIEPEFFGSKRVYTLAINMPNLTSGSGSWVLHFAELHEEAAGGRDEELSSPVALKKVDPRYVPSAVRERVEGTVTLAAMISRDGTVSHIRVLRGLDPRLDASAAVALSDWQFAPAKKHGNPVDLEVVVQIPFRLPTL